jgi:type IV secretory pathway VirB2 component (pilin)
LSAIHNSNKTTGGENKMSKLSQIIKSPIGKCLIAVFWVCVLCSAAWADLESGMEDLQSKVLSISTPLAIIFLIIAAWQKAMGNNTFFFAALVGTVIMFSAPQIVEFIRISFGG